MFELSAAMRLKSNFLKNISLSKSKNYLLFIFSIAFESNGSPALRTHWVTSVSLKVVVIQLLLTVTHPSSLLMENRSTY